MKVLVIGSGGREHALAWRLSRSPRVRSIASCPGNGGLLRLGPCWRDIDPETQQDALLKRVQEEHVDLVVVGPEGPLVAGLADHLRAARIPTFGPGREASRLEGSKAYAKRFMERHRIPTARFTIVDHPGELRAAIASLPHGVVVKASGLAGGKGVVITRDEEEACAVAETMLTGARFGAAGKTVVIEEKLEGVEITMLAFVSGRQYRLLHAAQDYKPLEDGNRGPNTGGMGAYSPTHLLTDAVRQRIVKEVLEPTLAGLEKEDLRFQGVLYLGLMLTASGPMVLEYNVRFGDPEAQPLLMRLQTDLIDVFDAVDRGRLPQLSLEWEERSAVCVVLAMQGYPHSYPKGLPIEGPAWSDPADTVQVFHAGTSARGDSFETAGGRVLGVTALGADLKSAREQAYERAGRIGFQGKIYRSDIARDY